METDVLSKLSKEQLEELVRTYARKRKGMPLHPCLSVGIREYAFFAKTIDDRIVCEPVSCFPRVSDPGCACSWRFTMGNPENGPEEAPDNNGQGKV